MIHKAHDRINVEEIRRVLRSFMFTLNNVGDQSTLIVTKRRTHIYTVT